MEGGIETEGKHEQVAIVRAISIHKYCEAHLQASWQSSYLHTLMKRDPSRVPVVPKLQQLPQMPWSLTGVTAAETERQVQREDLTQTFNGFSTHHKKYRQNLLCIFPILYHIHTHTHTPFILCGALRELRHRRYCATIEGDLFITIQVRSYITCIPLSLQLK